MEPVDIAVSSMAMHHVKDTAAFAKKVYKMLKPGGRMAIADLEKEDGTFHGEDSAGVKHHGFERSGLEKKFKAAGFKNIRFSTAYEIPRGKKEYPVFLMIGEKK
jgi:2-polyprenyl-3-methyl-5-hydroxy-6-metoxy-1,4-benzoquinol methylase